MRRTGGALLLALLVVAAPAGAQPGYGYRWVDAQGNVHYAGRLDQVPERYRDLVGPARPGERPRLTPPGPRAARPPAPGECVLRFRGTERRAGASRFYPSCEACWKALKAMRGDEKARTECIAASVESYR